MNALKAKDKDNNSNRKLRWENDKSKIKSLELLCDLNNSSFRDDEDFDLIGEKLRECGIIKI